MPNSDLLPSLLFKINENQLALEVAVMELTLWVEQRELAEVAGNVRGALQTIDKNEEFINCKRAPVLAPPCAVLGTASALVSASIWRHIWHRCIDLKTQRTMRCRSLYLM